MENFRYEKINMEIFDRSRTSINDLCINHKLRLSFKDRDDIIQIALSGFTVNSYADLWDKDYEDFVINQYDYEFSPERFFLHGEVAMSLSAFSIFFFGYAFGEYNKGLINDSEFNIIMFQLPGYLMSESVDLYSELNDYIDK